MKTIGQRIHRFLHSEDGPTAVEYVVMLGLIVLVCLLSIHLLGTSSNQAFTTVANTLSGGR
jgi:pilus assembly protein Flp/PilA